MSPLESSVITGGIGIAGVLLGGSLTAFLNYKLGAKQRKLELYKTAFPKKFESAADIMSKSREAIDETRRYFVSDSGLKVPNQFSEVAREKNRELANAIKTNMWLFEAEFTDLAWTLVQKLEISCLSIHQYNVGGTVSDLDSKVEEYVSFNSQADRIIADMTVAIRKELHVMGLSNALY